MSSRFTTSLDSHPLESAAFSPRTPETDLRAVQWDGQRAATAHPLEVQLSHSAKARRADRGVAHCAVFASVLSFSAGLTRTPAKEESFHRLRGLQHAFCRQAPS
jgi:hypothetical protein